MTTKNSISSPRDPVSVQMVKEGGSSQLKITIWGILPAKKNEKMAAGKFLITRPKIRKRLDKAKADLESALFAYSRTGGEGILMVKPLPSWICSLLPEDDCWEQIPEVILKGRLSEKGEERVEIYIEKI